MHAIYLSNYQLHLTIENARNLFGIIDSNISLEILNNIISYDQKKLIVLLQELRIKGVDFRILSSSIIDSLRLGLFTSNGILSLEGYSNDHLLNVKKTFEGIDSKKLLLMLENFLSLISLRTETFDILLESALIHLSYSFENSTQKAEPINKPENKTFEDNGSNAQISKLGIEETNKVSIENHNSIEKDDWEKVLFDLRRVKFGKMVLGGLLRNVEIPKKIDDKLTLKFKSKHLHDLFKAEWKIDLAREAVRNAVIKVYGEKIKLVLEEPEDEKKNNIDEKNILDSSIVKSALAMGAKKEEEKEG